MMERDNKLSELIAAACDEPAVGEGLRHRVMLAVAQRAVARSRRRARMGLVASLSGLAMLLGACVALLVVWFPALLPDFARVSWLEGLRAVELESVAALPPFEQWGGVVIVVLLVGGAAGFIYYLNSLFSENL